MKPFAFLPFLFASLSATCQTLPLLEQNPASVQWRQMRTPQFRIIYPAGADSTARRTANLLQAAYGPVSQSLGTRPRRLPVVLQTQTTIANGFVSMLPRRSEFFTTPPQDATLAGTNEWLGLLAVHEFRHVAQYEKMRTGLTKWASWLLGNNALAVIGITVPDWFWEGDAVDAETVFTDGGRGRIPRFDLEFRTRLLTGGPFSYSKATCGSYRDYVPNHYVLGYFLTSHLRQQKESGTWGRILGRHYRFPFEPFSFSGAVRRETGRRVEQLYHEAAGELTGRWRAQQAQLAPTHATLLPAARQRTMTNYEFPQYLDNQTIICQKSGIGEVETFVQLQRKNDTVWTERKLFVPGTVEFNGHASSPSNGMLSVAAGQVVWAEHTFDPRWNRRDYAVVKVLDIATRKPRTLTRRSKLFAPSLSPDGRHVVAVEVPPAGTAVLRLLDARTGAADTVSGPWLRDALPLAAGGLLLMPRFSAEGGRLVAVVLDSAGKSLAVFDLAARTVRRITFGDENISHPVLHGDYAYYNSPYSGIDNLYALHLPTGRKYQVTSRKFGAYNAALSPDGRQLAFHDFTPSGFRIATMPNDPAAWTPLEELPGKPAPFIPPQPDRQNLLRLAGDAPYPVRPFRPWANLLNPYSWGPVVGSTGNELFVGVSSQDLLSTLALQTGAAFDANQQTASYGADASYQGLYPVLDLSVATAGRRGSAYIDRRQPLDSLRTDVWRENRVSGGIRLPLVFTRSRFREALSLSAYGSLTDVSDYGLATRRYSEPANGTLYDMRYRLQYNRLHKQSRRDVFPRWGQQLALQHRHTLPGSSYSGYQFSAQAGLYVPGLGKHHGLLLRGAYKYEDVSTANDSYRFAASLLFPRGHAYSSSAQYAGASADYRLPLAYPDWAAGRWLYLQRIKANLFADYGRLATGSRRDALATVGMDLSLDFNVMRLRTPFELGVRTLYQPLSGTWLVQPLVIDIGF